MVEVSDRVAFRPVTFAGCVGHFAPGTRPIAVLLCSPWGFEDLSARKSWRGLAEQVVAAGFPCLRFDLPGTGDSLGDAPTFAAWQDGVRAASRLLADLAGTSRLALVGQGLGATLAYLEAARLPSVEGLVLMAPVVRGRAQLRELAAWEQMISGSMGYATEIAEAGGLTLAGFEMPAGLVAEIGTVDLAASPPPAPRHALIVTRAKDAASAERLAARLADTGCDTRTMPYEGYDSLVNNPMSSVRPDAVFAEVVAFLVRGDSGPSRGTTRVARREPGPPARLAGPDFTEMPVRFGPDERLFGMLCEPVARIARQAALIVNTGSDHHTGWGRIGVEQARALARAGIASLRFDSAGIGDSPQRPGGPEQVIYSDEQTADALAALDRLQEAGYPAVTVVGRCSGGYLALHTALADPRVTGLVLVNIQRFAWNPTESVEDALRHVPRSLNEYGSRVMGIDLWLRMLRGEVDVVRGAANMLRRLALRVAPRIARGRDWARLHDRVHADLATLRDRHVAIDLVYSECDVSLDEYGSQFGGRARSLALYPNMTFTLVPAADHNFTPASVRRILFASIVRHFEGSIGRGIAARGPISSDEPPLHAAA